MDASFWEHVELSKQMTPEQRFMGTLEMIDFVRSINVAGIRSQFPNASEEEVKRKLADRYRIARRLDERIHD
jgi:hypothetical protein